MSPPAGLLDRPFAHRGLWTPAGPPENSLAAFEAACQAGFGVELDVRLSADGEAMVFHDDTLDRLTADSGLVQERTAEDLGALALCGGDQTIPTLAQVLSLVDDRAWLLIELKTADGQTGLLEAAVVKAVAAHRGPFALIGFSVAAHLWLADHAPRLTRGFSVRTLADLAHVEETRPHFLAADQTLLVLEAAKRRRAGGLPIVAWTIQDRTQLRHARELADNVIFEGLRP